MQPFDNSLIEPLTPSPLFPPTPLSQRLPILINFALRLFALGNRGDELIARFNDGIFAVRNSFCAHARGLEM